MTKIKPGSRKSREILLKRAKKKGNKTRTVFLLETKLSGKEPDWQPKEKKERARYFSANISRGR